jgi:hypothetical protein
VNGSKNKFHASREHIYQQHLHLTKVREEAAATTGSVYSAQLGMSTMGTEGNRYVCPDKTAQFITERESVGQHRGLESFLEMKQQAAQLKSDELTRLAQQREAFINAELQMRLLRDGSYFSLSTGDRNKLPSTLLLANSLPSSEGDSTALLSRTLLAGRSQQDRLSRSMLEGLSQQDRFVQRILATDVAASMPVPLVGVLNQPNPLSNDQVRMLAQSLGDATWTQQREAVARWGLQVFNDSADFSSRSSLNQCSNTEMIRRLATNPAFDISSSLTAQHGENGNLPKLSSLSRASAQFDGTQISASLPWGILEARPTEQLLQLYLLKQQQQQHQRQHDRSP